MTSLHEPVTVGSRRALAAYTAVATTARLGDAGAGVGVVLLAVDRDGPARGALVGGLLAAALTAPHVLGPWTGRLLDTGRPRWVLAGACLVFAFGLAAGALALVTGRVALAAPAFVVAGTAGPLLTGGLSSLVGRLGGDPARARGIDALTYGVAGTVGPATVAALAAAASPALCLVVVAVVVALASPGLLLLPLAVDPDADPGTEPDLGTEPNPGPTGGRTGGRTAAGPAGSAASSAGVGLLFASRPLRAVTVATMAAAAAGGALAVVAVLLATELTGSTRVGPWFVAALGIGNLLGALVVTWRPWRRDPVRGGLAVAAVLGVSTAAVAAVPTVAVGLLVFGVVGGLTAAWVTATLAARDRLAPPAQRGQVFVAMSGLKTAAGSGGTALAGVVSAWGARPLALGAGALVVITTMAVRPRRRASPGHR